MDVGVFNIVAYLKCLHLALHHLLSVLNVLLAILNTILNLRIRG